MLAPRLKLKQVNDCDKTKSKRKVCLFGSSMNVTHTKTSSPTNPMIRVSGFQGQIYDEIGA